MASIGESGLITRRQCTAAGARSRCARSSSCYVAGSIGERLMAFDPNAATARYIDSLGPAALQKAHDYTIGKEWMLLWALLVVGVVTWLIVRSGLLDKLDAKLGERRRNLRALVVSFVFLIVSTVLSLPRSLYADYFREKSYGRTSQPLGDFLMQGAIAALISAVVGALFFMGVYWLMRRTGKRWWLWSGGLAAVVLAF